MENNVIKVPWWFWLVSGLFTLWNLYGGWDFYNSVTVNETYLMALGDEMGPAFIKFLTEMPLWAKLAWGIAIISSILASICLLLRKAVAVPLFILAFVAMIISFIYQLFIAKLDIDMPVWMKAMTGVVTLIAIIEIWFARRMRAKGILR